MGGVRKVTVTLSVQLDVEFPADTKDDDIEDAMCDLEYEFRLGSLQGDSEILDSEITDWSWDRADSD